MKTMKQILGIAALLWFGLTLTSGQGTAFIYQGRLDSGGSLYTGSAEFQPTLWDAVSGGAPVATNSPATLIVGVSNGLFVLPLDFGGAPFAAGAERWLQLEVRTSIGPFKPLSPRQKLAPTPYAISAGSLASSLPASQLTGRLSSAQLGGTYSGALTFDNAGNTYTGNGAALTGLNASQLTSGTIPDARLSAGVARTDQVWMLNGNAGSTTAFLGWTDNRFLEFRVNNERAMLIQPTTGGTPNIVAGVKGNTVQGSAVGATISGGGEPGTGNNAIVGGDYGVIGGGRNNYISISHDSTIGGGDANAIASYSDSSTISGGSWHRIGTNSAWSSIGGGYSQRIDSNSGYGTVGGGRDNDIASNSEYATISGGDFNDVGTSSAHSTIGGGSNNDVGTNSPYSTIGGGGGNLIGNGVSNGTTSGGQGNTIQTNASYASIGGGYANTIQPDGFYGTIPGGEQNSATNRAFAAGSRAKANHIGSFVWADWGGGADFASSAPNQFLIRANGGLGINKNNPSTALDVNGTVTANAFSGSGASLTSLNASQLTAGTLPDGRLGSDAARRSGGNAFTGNQTVTSGRVGIGTTDPQNPLHVHAAFGGSAIRLTSGASWPLTVNQSDSSVCIISNVNKPVLTLAGAAVGIGTTNPSAALDVDVSPPDASIRLRSGASWPVIFNQNAASSTFTITNGYGLFAMQAAGNVGIGTNAPSQKLVVAGNIYATGSITPNSDRNAKTDFAPVDPAAVLERVAQLPIQQWRFKREAEDVKHVGPMAQDFRAAFGLGEIPTAIATVDADGVALAAIQGLNLKLEAENAELKRRLERLEQIVQQLTQ